MTLVSQLAAKGSCTWRNSCSTLLGAKPLGTAAPAPSCCRTVVGGHHLEQGTVGTSGPAALVHLPLNLDFPLATLTPRDKRAYRLL